MSKAVALCTLKKTVSSLAEVSEKTVQQRARLPEYSIHANTHPPQHSTATP